MKTKQESETMKTKKWKMMKWTGNDIGDEGARMISEALKINTTLTSLYLWSDDNE